MLPVEVALSPDDPWPEFCDPLVELLVADAPPSDCPPAVVAEVCSPPVAVADPVLLPVAPPSLLAVADEAPDDAAEPPSEPEVLAPVVAPLFVDDPDAVDSWEVRETFSVMDPVSEPMISVTVAEAVSEPLVIRSVDDSKMLEGSIDARPVESPSSLVEVCVV